MDKITDIPESELAQVLEDIEFEGFKVVSKFKAANGMWTVVFSTVLNGSAAGAGTGTDNADDVAAVPSGNPVAFASTGSDISGLVWPVITDHPSAQIVSHIKTNGDQIGRSARSFLADRSNGKRYHVGVDIFCYEADEVVACADGVIVAFYRFYTTNSGEESFALLVDHGDFVANYGEVKQNAREAFGWQLADHVTAGQKIAAVSSTNMIHFETYTTGTKASQRWMKSEPRPAALRNPSRLLVSIAKHGKRIVKGGVAVNATVEYNGVQPDSVSWHNRFDGRRWRYDSRGVYTKDQGEETIWRTPGEPATCREIFRLYKDPILAAALKHGVNPALIVMTIATETAIYRPYGFTGPKTFRWESHVKNTDVNPVFKGTYSAGPMQCLATTARDIIKRKGAAYGLDYPNPMTTFEAITPRPQPAPENLALYDARINMDIGAAEIRSNLSKTKDDPILVAAAFNTGGIYQDPNSPWGLRAHGDHLDRAARWYGDTCAVMSEFGVF